MGTLFISSLNYMISGYKCGFEALEKKNTLLKCKKTPNNNKEVKNVCFSADKNHTN